MPANLGPEYLKAEERFRQATTDEERLLALEEMLATIPKHKGTEKMQADIKRRIAQLRREMQKSRGPRRRDIFRIDREGAGQIVMVGPPNCGKSQLLAAMTRAQPEIAPYPFTTRLPLPGMVRWENVQIQLVDMPPLTRDTVQSWMWAVMRSADALLLVADLSDDDVLDRTEDILEFTRDNGVALVGTGETTFGKKRSLVAANKADVAGARDRLELLKEFVRDRLPVFPVSALTGEGLDALAKAMFFDLLGKIRVYTHPPGKKPDFSNPFILDAGTTVLEAAEEIHKEIAANLAYARVWGSGMFRGQMVPRDHVLQDGDVVVFYT